MKLKIWNRFLLDVATDNNTGGGGSGAGGSLLTTPPGGGQSGASGGSSNPAGGAAPIPPAAGSNNAGIGTPGDASANWRSSLPAELQEEPGLKLFNDVSALAKSYVHAQRSLGADKIAIPSKLATDEDWQGVYQKLGLPKEIKDYKVEFQKDSTIEPAFAEKFKEQAHKSGILPQQAQKLADWFSQTNKDYATEITKARDTKVKADMDGLKSEWGKAFDQNLARAGQVIKELADPELNKYLDESGLGNDPKLIKLFSKVAEKFMTEGKHIGGDAGGTPTLDPAGALKEANSIRANGEHPFNNPSHPNHKTAVMEMNALFEQAYPSPT